MRRTERIAVIHCARPAGAEPCGYGCTGCGNCYDVCRRDAIRCVDGPASVDRSLCIGCGLCVKACPRQLITLEPVWNNIQVLCINKNPGKEARRQCETSCIGCGICERSCPADAIHVQESCAVIDRERCIACGMCAVSCPRGVIHDANGILADE